MEALWLNGSNLAVAPVPHAQQFLFKQFFLNVHPFTLIQLLLFLPEP